jgi:hypothetical protein
MVHRKAPSICGSRPLRRVNHLMISAFARHLNQEVTMKSMLIGLGMIAAAATFASAEEVTVEKRWNSRL